MVPQTLPLVEDTHVYPENYRGAHVIKPQMTALALAFVIVKDEKHPTIARPLDRRYASHVRTIYPRPRANSCGFGWHRLCDRNHLRPWVL